MKLVLLSAYLISYCNSFTIPSIYTFKIRQRSTISNILLNERHTIDINVDVNVDIKTENVNQNNNNMLPQINNTSSSSSYNTRYTNGQQTSTSVSITHRKQDGGSSIKLPTCNAQQQKAYSSELSYATNFTKTIHDIVIQYIIPSSSIVDLPLQYFEFQWQNDNLATPSSISEDTNSNNISTNYGVLDLVKSLITAENEQQIDNALANDFTTTDSTKLSVGESAGIGCGLQIYRKGKLVLTVGGGGGGGGRSYTVSSEEGYECGGGGGASIFLPDSNVIARVGGGHGMQAGYETEHNPKLFIEQLQRLRDLYSKADINDVAIMGGGGGGSGLTTNTSGSNGRGYGFGFEIGSMEGINLAKKNMSRRTNEASSDNNGNPLNLPEHLLNEEWAIQVAEYI